MGNIISSSCFSNSTINCASWVIDTGATHHVCCDFSLFSQSTPIQNTTVTLRNGDNVHIDRIGTASLSDNIILQTVLFVSLFTFNLLSVSALTHSHNCCVNFISNSCLIQDLTQCLTIGKGRRQNSPYYLELGIDQCNSVLSCSVFSKNDIWHSRLGHPSHVKLKILHNDLHMPNSLSSLSSHCKICHMAKQKLLPFVSHNHMSARPFNLLHMDI